jgi:class 3 adenylate cyclase
VALGCLWADSVDDTLSSEKRVKSTMARYMTKDVADRLLAGGQDALGGQAQVASVLFSDIRSFTTISETLGARDTVAMLNEYFTAMIEVLFEHKGILDKYIGDAIMAVFGAPFQTPTDADNAVMAALGADGAFASNDARFWAAAGANAGHDANDRVVYNTSTGQVWYDADGSGSGAAQLVATLQAGAALGAGDITVI